MGFKEDLFIWGQDPMSHHNTNNNLYKLPGENKMTPEEGVDFFGIPNVCRVSLNNEPKPPFDNEAEKLKKCGKVVWSVIGDAGTDRTSTGGTDVQPVIDVSKKYKNIIGGVMDDFFSEERLKVYTADVIKNLADTLHKENLELWTVLYEHELEKDISAHLKECDVVTFWTWGAKNLPDLDKNYEKVVELAGKDARIMMGCYMWDYGGRAPMPMDMMKYQLEKYKKWYDEGKICGIIFCSNCIADIGLDTVDYTVEWIKNNTK